MKNEKGLTLVEILAAISISAIVFGVASTLYFSVQREWNNSTVKYNDNAQSQLTMDTVTGYLLDSKEVCLKGTQLLFRTGTNKLMSLTYEESNGVKFINLNKFNTTPPENLSAFSGTPNETITLASNLSKAPEYKKEDKDNIDPNSDFVLIQSNEVVKGGSLISITISFKSTTISSLGDRTTFDIPLNTVIKLLNN